MRELVQRCDLVVFATVAGPDVVAEAMNVVDAVAHCLREQASLHLTEQQAGNRDFGDGTRAPYTDSGGPLTSLANFPARVMWRDGT